MSACKYPVHPACALMPEMQEPDFLQLKKCINTIGQLESVLLWDGQVIDGRARLRACKELRLEPAVCEIDMETVLESGEPIDPWSLVWAYHMNRKHYDAIDLAKAQIAYENVANQVAASHEQISRKWKHIARKFQGISILSLFRQPTRIRCTRDDGSVKQFEPAL